MAKDSYYFSHDSNARTDPKITDMTYDYGMSGYGMYWVIIEILREESDYKLINNKSTWRALAMQMHSTSEIVEEFINKSINDYKLFVIENGFFYSKSLRERMNKVEIIKEKRKEAANKRWGNSQNDTNINANALQEQCTSNANLCKGNKIKENKKKELFIDTSIEVQLSKFLFEKMLENNPNAKKPNFQVWAKDINSMIRLDKRSEGDIRNIIEWSQNDSFWRGNILSAKKLRNQFDALKLKCDSENNAKTGVVKSAKKRIYGFG